MKNKHCQCKYTRFLINSAVFRTNQKTFKNAKQRQNTLNERSSSPFCTDLFPTGRRKAAPTPLDNRKTLHKGKFLLFLPSVPPLPLPFNLFSFFLLFYIVFLKMHMLQIMIKIEKKIKIFEIYKVFIDLTVMHYNCMHKIGPLFS